MKRGRFSEEQIVKILKEQEQGYKVGDICRALFGRVRVSGN